MQLLKVAQTQVQTYILKHLMMLVEILGMR